MAGLFKALGVLRYGTIPASLHLEPLNPGIDFGGLGLEPVARPRPLAPRDGRRFVGVNSFGLGGANAHVVVSAPPPAASSCGAAPDGELPVLASGHTPRAAEEAARRLAARLTAADPAEPAEFYDIAATSTVRRARHRYRRVALASSAHEAAHVLTASDMTGADTAGEAVKEGRVGLVFAGNGSQWAGMGADLLAEDAVFRAEVEAVDAALEPRLGWSVVAQLRRPAVEWDLTATEVAQPLLFAMQAGVTAVLRERGVRWTVALGHSFGEMAAAYAVGALTLEEAAWVVAERGRAQAVTAGGGRMAAMGLPSAEAERVLSAYPGLVTAAVNSARDVTVAGPETELKMLGDELTARDVFFRIMDLDYAFHSPAMEPVQAPLKAALAGLAPRGSTGALISTVTGGAVPESGLDADYWWRNTREPVRFTDAVEHALDRDVDVLLEVGPHPVLRTYLRRITAGRDRVAVLPTLRRDAPGPLALRRSVEALLAAGAETDWARWFPRPAKVAELPAYPWQRERHWSGTPQQWVISSGSGRLDHPLLGERLPSAKPSWQGPVEPALVPWLADHKVAGSVVFPAAAYAEMALAAGRRVLDGPVELAWMDISRPLVVPWDRAGDVRTQLAYSPDDGMVSVTSTEDADGDDAVEASPRLHARCRVRELIGRPPARVDLTGVRARCARRGDAGALYPQLASAGLEYGPAFRQLVRLHLGDGEALAAYRHTTDAPDAGQYVVHPALLDGAIQACVPLVTARTGAGQCWLPSSMGAVRVWRGPSASGMLHVRDRTCGTVELCFDITVTDPDGSVTAELEGVRLRRMPSPAERPPLRYETVLRAAPHLHLPAPLSPLPGNHDLAAGAAGSVAELEAGWRAANFAEFSERQKHLTAHVAAATFASLLPADATEFTLADLVRQGMVPGHGRLAEALLGLMSRHGLATAREGGRWQLTGTADPAPLLARLPFDFPAVGAEVRLAVEQLAHLPRVLRGQLDAPRLLTGQGMRRVLEQLYDVAPSCRFHNRIVAALAEQTVRVWPADRPLRILEIGAGTGGTTAALLPLLPPERTVYHFTDVSGESLTRARHRFSDHPFVGYRTFDLDADPAEQGFAEGTYDLIVAADSLHTATDLRAALHHVRGLLAPGGRLVAFETHDTDHLLPLFGALDSFWRHTDTLRSASPLLNREQWADALRGCGLGDVVCLGDTIEPAGRDIASVLLASASPDEPAQPELPRPEDGTRWLVATESEPETPLAEHLAGLLPGGPRSVPVVPAPADPAVWAETLTGDGDPAIVLVLGESPVGPQAMLDQAVHRAAMLRALAVACQNLPTGSRPALWLVTRPSGALPAPERARQPQDAAAWGMARTLANEHPGLRVTRLSLERQDDPAADAHRLARELLERDTSSTDGTPAAREDEIALTAGGRFVPRERGLPCGEHVTQGDGEPFALEIGAPGLSYEPVWTPARSLAPGLGEVVIEVRAAALNYRDIMQATGLLPPRQRKRRTGTRASAWNVPGPSRPSARAYTT
ncbi:hypothetical protein GCM10027091_08040 [Streptomyces daliensis]